MATKTIWLWPGWLSNCTKIEWLHEGSCDEMISILNGIITMNNLYLTLAEIHWSRENAPKLSVKANAQVIVIDWGSSELSCCSYPVLLFCHLNTISQWMAKIIQNCSSCGLSTSISNTWLLGHSLGAQIIGMIAQFLNQSGSKLEKIIGLDVAGPLFAQKVGSGKCHGIQKDIANHVVIFSTNPGGLGTESAKLANVHVTINQDKQFCQYGCDCNDSVCNHIYAAKTLLAALVDDEPLEGTHRLGNNENNHISKHKVTIYEPMKPGLYNIESDHNPSLQKQFKYRDLVDEL